MDMNWLKPDGAMKLLAGLQAGPRGLQCEREYVIYIYIYIYIVVHKEIERAMYM